MAECMHQRERFNASFRAWMYEHLSQPSSGTCAPSPHRTTTQRSCLYDAGNAKWSPAGLVDARPECGRHWVRTACARALFAGRDAMLVGNSVIRRQLFTLVELLAGPSARRLRPGSRGPKSVDEMVPSSFIANGGVDVGELADPLLRKQEGVLNTCVTSGLDSCTSGWVPSHCTSGSLPSQSTSGSLPSHCGLLITSSLLGRDLCTSLIGSLPSRCRRLLVAASC
jgi:hypothetical protein